MKIIDRYVIRIFVLFVLISLISVVLLYDLINFFDNLRYFLSRKMDVIDILTFYVYFTPSAISLLYPASIVIGGFITYGSLSQNNQLVVIKSSGINLNRIFLTLFITGIVLSLFFAVFNEFITTDANFKRRKMVSNISDKSLSRFFYIDKSGWVMYSTRYKNGIISRFFLIKRDKNHKIVSRIDGKLAGWQGNNWLARYVVVRNFENDSTVNTVFYDKMKLPILSTPQDFEKGGKRIEEMRVYELSGYIKDKKQAGWNVIPEEVELYNRWTFHLIGIILIIISFPIGTGLIKTGRVMGIGIGMLLSFFYWGALEVFRSFALGRVISPFMGAIMPHLLFLTAGLILFWKTNR